MNKPCAPIASRINWRLLLATFALACPLTALSAGSACLDLRGGDEAGGIGGTGAPAQNGIGGTGAPARGGVGGTGAPARGGVGGTGAPERGGDGSGGIGGTGSPLAELGDSIGIFGTITGFASVCVNGLEVHYDDATPVSMNGSPANLKDLAVGQVVSLEAKLGPRGLITREIAVLHALNGPVSQRVPPGQARQQLSVMGQAVIVTPATRGDAVNQALNPGNAVRVSGMPNANGTIIATRIDHAPTSSEHTMFGTLGSGQVHGVRVSGHQERSGERAEVLVKGHWDGQQLNVREQRENPATGFIGRVNRVVIEGVVPDTDRTGNLRLGRLQVQTTNKTRIEGSDTEVRRGQRVTITGRVDANRQIRADKIEISGDQQAQAPGRQSTNNSGGSSARDEHRDKKDDDRSGRSGGDDRLGSSSDDRSGRSGGERIERVEIERIEKVEKVEKVEVIERVERIERPDDSGRNRGGR